MTLSLEAQRHNLRTHLAPQRLRGLRRGAWIIVAVLAAVGLATGSPIPWLLAAFAAVVALAVRQTEPHVLAARRALDAGATKPGRIRIQVEHWSDTDHYRASTVSWPGGDWRFEFIPQGWTPRQGLHDVQCYRLDDVAWPALIATEDGLLFPRETPTRAAEPLSSG